MGVDSLVACDSVIWNATYDSSGKYLDTLQTINGCDSVVTLNLTINNSVNTDTTIITSCDSAEWRGNTYTLSGLYYDTLQTTAGCDSIVTLDLTINYTSYTIDSIIACDSVISNGNLHDSSGICRYVTNDSWL